MRMPDGARRLDDRVGELVRLVVGRAVGPVVDVVELADRRVAGARGLASKQASLGDGAHAVAGRARRAAAYIASRHVQKSSCGTRRVDALDAAAQVRAGRRASAR